jgi:hypothetical protein
LNHRISLSFLLCITSVQFASGQIDNSNYNNIKLGLWYGILYEQYAISLSYSKCINNSEISFGINYRDFNYESLILWKLNDTKATIYGVKFGFIRKLRMEKKLVFDMNGIY